MNAREFLTELWGPQPEGFIQLWELERKRSAYYAAPIGVAVDGRRDVFTGVGLAGRRLTPNVRAKANEVVAIAGLWLDIDVNGGPDNKTGGVPDQAAANRLARSTVEPTIIVDSGYGVHAWYLLGGGPWRFHSLAERTEAAQMSAQWYALHRKTATDLFGWGLDPSTRDLARVLRLPGTLNAKDPANPKPVTVISTGPRYWGADLKALCNAAPPIDDLRIAGTPGAAAAVIARDGHPPSAKIEALLENDDTFAATWNHDRRDTDHWSMSEWDMSLASQAAIAGLDDQEIADLITEHRNHWDPDGRKAGRGDYLTRTVAKARERSQRETAAKNLAAMARRAA